MIELRPHKGLCRGREVDLGLDAVFEVSPVYPKGRRLGYVDRRRGAAVQLIEPVAESIVAEIRRAVDARDYEELRPEFAAATAIREVFPAPPLLPDEDDEDNEE